MKTVSHLLNTAAPHEAVMTALMQALQRSGGQIQRVSQDTVKVLKGNANVQFAFVADVNGTFTVRPVQGGYEILGYLETAPSVIFWVCLVGGFFFLWFLWIVNALYFFIDPTQAYMQLLSQIRV